MSDQNRYADPEGGFDFLLPAGWTARPDTEAGGVEVEHPDGAGSLHLIAFPQPEGDFPDPAEELYSFLAEQGVEIEEEEVEDVELAGGGEMALTEYATDDEAEEGATFWMVGVATAPGTLLFATYTCEVGEEDEERGTVRALLGSLRLRAAE